MTQAVIKSSYNGISQDRDYGSDGECTYMQDVNTDNMKSEQLEKGYFPSTYLSFNGDTTYSNTISDIKETPAGLISCGNSIVFYKLANQSATVAGATRMEYKLDSAGVQTNYFFNNTNVIRTNSDVSSIGGTTPKASGLTTSSVVVYNTILFTVGSTVYSYDMGTNTISTALATLNTGVTVKYMYFYNDILTIVSSMGIDTIIYQVQYTASTGAYAIYSTEVKQGISCVGAIGDGNIVYWLSTNRIFGFSGGSSQEIRYIGLNSSLDEATFTSSPKLAFTDGDLYIGAGTTIYIWGAKHAGRKNHLRVKTAPGTIQGITANFLHTSNSTTSTNWIYGNGNKYPNSGFTITLPYDTGIYGDKKSELAFRVGYRLPTSTSIDIGVMTDAMEMENTANYINVVSITDTTKRRQRIDIAEINAALAAAGKDSDWQSIRFKRTYNGGGGTSGFRDNTPIFYEMKLIHNDIENGLHD